MTAKFLLELILCLMGSVGRQPWLPLDPVMVMLVAPLCVWVVERENGWVLTRMF